MERLPVPEAAIEGLCHMAVSMNMGSFCVGVTAIRALLLGSTLGP